MASLTSEDAAYLTIREARRLLDSGDVSAEELTRLHIERIEQLDTSINAFTTLSAERALEASRDFDRRRGEGEQPRTPLDGVPMSLKDVLCWARPTATSSRWARPPRTRHGE
jgi:aspartyl-tRNA(Asn)/glutamyl-tRNA(Gln) amidotransferase subunit A